MLTFFIDFISAINVNRVLVTNIAVNIEHRIPTLRVIANPRIGPDPTQASTNATINVVKFASKIVIMALS